MYMYNICISREKQKRFHIPLMSMVDWKQRYQNLFTGNIQEYKHYNAKIKEQYLQNVEILNGQEGKKATKEIKNRETEGLETFP